MRGEPRWQEPEHETALPRSFSVRGVSLGVSPPVCVLGVVLPGAQGVSEITLCPQDGWGAPRDPPSLRRGFRKQDLLEGSWDQSTVGPGTWGQAGARGGQRKKVPDPGGLPFAPTQRPEGGGPSGEASWVEGL